MLKEEDFFENLYSHNGEVEKHFNEIRDAINKPTKKTIVLLGYQGCGKTTFINRIRYTMGEIDFNLMELDTDTSNVKIPQYIEKYSSLLLKRFCDYDKNRKSINTKFYNLYKDNKEAILDVFNAENNLGIFMEEFRKIFVFNNVQKFVKYNFINDINGLFFGQILFCVILLDIAEFVDKGKIKSKIYCMDNIDILVNSVIVEDFFSQYYNFSRNMNKVIQNFNIKEIDGKRLSFGSIFKFIICSRESTWSKVANGHTNDAIMDMTKAIDVSNAYDKVEIVNKRIKFLNNIENEYTPLWQSGNKIKVILQDLSESRKKSIFVMFNNDYRRCVTCLEYLLNNSPNIVSTYEALHNFKCNSHKFLYGARGMIYRGIWDIFKKQDLFKNIGVVNLEMDTKPYSDARLILTYLSNSTSSDIGSSTCIDLDILYRDLITITSKKEIQRALCSMYNIRRNTYWNQLISFSNIKIGNHDEVEESFLDNANNEIKVHITKAGETYLDLIATHFEFFSCRIVRKKEYNKFPLFMPKNWRKKEKGRYYFQYLIENVLIVVGNCCKKLHEFYSRTNYNQEGGKKEYLESFFVYQPIGGMKVFHGERIIHTHISYLDAFRLYLLSLSEFVYEEKVQINYLLVDYILQYIDIGRRYPNILSEVSEGTINKKDQKGLFDKFLNRIKVIDQSGYSDFESQIDA